MTQDQQSDQGKAALSLKKMLPIAILFCGLVAFFALGLDDFISFEALRQNREFLIELVAGHQVLSVAIFVTLYILTVAFSLPIAVYLTLGAGFLFGAVWAAIYVVCAATIGATILFLAAKSAFGDLLRARAGPSVQKMEAGFRENAFSYLLFLRLVPAFPFFLVNLAPAFLGVPLRTYVVATFIGIMPGTFVFASVGAGLGSLFTENAEFTLASVMTTEIRIALTGLAVLALLPVVVRKIRGRERPGSGAKERGQPE